MPKKPGVFLFSARWPVKVRSGFKNGFPDGKFVEYHPNHQIATMGYYKNTAKVGEWILYDQNGKIIAKMFFDSNGNLLKKAIPTP